MTRYVGVDLHMNSLTACYLESGQEVRFKTYRLTPAALRCFKRGLVSSDELAVEATGNTEFFIEAVGDSVSRVVVVNPRQFKVIRSSTKKTNKNDAQALAYFLSKDMLPESRRKSAEHRHVGSLSQTQDKFVKSRTYFMNKIHEILNTCGIKLKKESLGTEKGLQRVLAFEVDEVSQFEVSILVDQIRALNVSMKRLNKKLVEVRIMNMWTSPTEQSALYGACEQAMDNANALPTTCSHSLASRQHTHNPNKNNFFILNLRFF